MANPALGFGLSVRVDELQNTPEFVEDVVSVFDAKASVASQNIVEVAEPGIGLQVAVNLILELGESVAIPYNSFGGDYVVSLILFNPVGLILVYEANKGMGVKTVFFQPFTNMGDEPCIVFSPGLADVIKPLEGGSSQFLSLC